MSSAFGGIKTQQSVNSRLKPKATINGDETFIPTETLPVSDFNENMNFAFHNGAGEEDRVAVDNQSILSNFNLERENTDNKPKGCRKWVSAVLRKMVDRDGKEKKHRSFSVWLLQFCKKHISFYRLHFLYFIVVDLIGTLVIFLLPPTKLGRIKFIDALFSSTSALTVTGLASVKMGTFSIVSEVMLLVLMLSGGQVFTSLLPVMVRRYYFQKYLKQAEKSSQGKQLLATQITVSPSPALQNLRPISEGRVFSSSNLSSINNSQLDGIQANMSSPGRKEEKVVEREVKVEGREVKVEEREVKVEEMEEKVEEWAEKVEVKDEKAEVREQVSDDEEAPPLRRSMTQTNYKTTEENHPQFFTWSGETAKLAGQKFKVLRKQQELEAPLLNRRRTISREELPSRDPAELRSQEYKALQLLTWLVPSYLFGLQLLGFFIMQINFWGAPRERRILSENGVNATFFSAFQAISAFQNAGYGLLDSSLVYFNKSVLVLLIHGVLILLGNTLYAPTIRGILYALYRGLLNLQRRGYNRLTDLTETLKYLLDHPRRCFTHLFPWHQTLWLVITVVIFNAVEVLFFCALDWNVDALSGLSGGYKFLDGLFQSLNTRSSGFIVVPLSGLSPAMLVLYIGMMYIAAYPVFLSRQLSKAEPEVYDDHELGVFHVLNIDEERESQVIAQGRKLIARDSAFLFIAMFLICLIQSSEIRKDPNFTMFNILFELISAYGNVGLSLGYTCVPSDGDSCTSPPYSFSGVWKTSAKLVLVLVMLLGRHRGLPDSIDSAVTIPSEETFQPGLRRSFTGTPGSRQIVMTGAPIPRQFTLGSQRASVFERVSSFLGGESRGQTPTAGSTPRKERLKSSSVPY